MVLGCLATWGRIRWRLLAKIMLSFSLASCCRDQCWWDTRRRWTIGTTRIWMPLMNLIDLSLRDASRRRGLVGWFGQLPIWWKYATRPPMLQLSKALGRLLKSTLEFEIKAGFTPRIQNPQGVRSLLLTWPYITGLGASLATNLHPRWFGPFDGCSIGLAVWEGLVRFGNFQLGIVLESVQSLANVWKYLHFLCCFVLSSCTSTPSCNMISCFFLSFKAYVFKKPAGCVARSFIPQRFCRGLRGCFYGLYLLRSTDSQHPSAWWQFYSPETRSVSKISCLKMAS